MVSTIVRWLWPIVIGTPLIMVWIRRYQQTFGENTTPGDIAATLKQDMVEVSNDNSK